MRAPRPWVARLYYKRYGAARLFARNRSRVALRRRARAQGPRRIVTTRRPGRVPRAARSRIYRRTPYYAFTIYLGEFIYIYICALLVYARRRRGELPSMGRARIPRISRAAHNDGAGGPGKYNNFYCRRGRASPSPVTAGASRQKV